MSLGNKVCGPCITGDDYYIKSAHGEKPESEVSKTVVYVFFNISFS